VAQGDSRHGGAQTLVLQGFFAMEPLEPGSYDGVVIDVDELPDDAVSIEIALSSGPHKGSTVHVRGPRGRRDPLSLLALPVTLEVTSEGIRVDFDKA
jgi:hypothetical protein